MVTTWPCMKSLGLLTLTGNRAPQQWHLHGSTCSVKRSECMGLTVAGRGMSGKDFHCWLHSKVKGKGVDYTPALTWYKPVGQDWLPWQAEHRPDLESPQHCPQGNQETDWKVTLDTTLCWCQFALLRDGSWSRAISQLHLPFLQPPQTNCWNHWRDFPLSYKNL